MKPLKSLLAVSLSAAMLFSALFQGSQAWSLRLWKLPQKAVS